MRPAVVGALLILPVAALGQSDTPQRPPTFHTGVEVIRLNLLLRFRGRDPAGRVFLHARRAPVVRRAPGRLLGFDGREAPRRPGGRRAVRQDLAARGPRAGGAIQRPDHRPSGLHRGPLGPRGRGEEHAGRGADRALQRPLRRLEAAAETGQPGSAATARHRAAHGRRRHGFGRQRRPGAGARPPGRRLAFSQATYFLTTLTRDSGGETYFPNSLSELDAVYGRVAEELRSQYTVGYVSRNDRRNGQWRRIVVRTPAREGLQVRHKIGYYASKG